MDPQPGSHAVITSAAASAPLPLSEQAQRSRGRIVGLLTGAQSEQGADLRVLLHRRLRGLTGILLFLMVGFNLRSVLISRVASLLTLSDRLVALGSVVLLAGVLVLTSVKKRMTVAQLRGLELALLGLLTMALGYMTYIYFSRGSALSFAPPPELVTQLGRNAWAIYPDNSVHVQAGFQALLGFVLLRWCMLVVLYGVVIPNTWQRCAVMMLLIILGFVATMMLSARHLPALKSPLGQTLALALPLLTAFAAIGLYGCHKLSSLREQVFAARQIGQYHLERRLGGGGMGEVYLARHRLLRRPCALKLIRPDQASSVATVTRFEREVQAMAQLTHPNTVEIYDYGRTGDGTFYYVMEYLPGTSLESLVKRYGPLSGGRAIYLLQQACRALREAHAAGLIHRDIKPGNMFVCERGGEFDRLKLLDFGLVQVAGAEEPVHVKPPPGAKDEDAVSAKAAGAGSRDVKLTQLGHILGTPAYMSPEQVYGEDADPRTDIYSLGAVAFYFLTGQPPFLHATSAEMYQAHISEPPRSPRLLRPEVPPDLEAVVLRCLSKERSQRYGSTQELELALLACQCGQDWSAAQAEHWWRLHAPTSDATSADPTAADAADESGLSSARTSDTARPPIQV